MTLDLGNELKPGMKRSLCLALGWHAPGIFFWGMIAKSQPSASFDIHPVLAISFVGSHFGSERKTCLGAVALLARLAVSRLLVEICCDAFRE